MDQIAYVGEHLWYGKIGHFSILLGFSACIAAIFAYAFSKNAVTTERKKLMRLGKVAVIIQSSAVFIAFGLLLAVMIGRYYEYDYVWGHVSDHLPFAYIFSAFWEGQEGSFLLWMFWHAVLALILVSRKKPWENGVLMTLCAIQAFLFFMILGIYVGDQRIGINPFILFREAKAGIPILSNPNYLELIDGQGLNPLLQNYWNVIHPPTTFLGFASMSIPFCFAVDAWWKRDFTSWLPSVLVWSLFGVGVLGVGILMGGAWAYEALSFGGYWAWDPVENGILVPWLLAVAGLHTNVVARSTQQSIKSTYVFYALAFWFTIYATFLTRSGVLGDTSVHAFTQMGLEWQLLIMLGFFGVWPIAQYWFGRKYVPVPKKEEHIASREFWMFMGSLVLLFSAGLITFTTSIPVFNKIIDFVAGLGNWNFDNLKRDVPLDPVAHHNRFQIWIAIFIAFFSAVGQWLRYMELKWNERYRFFLKKFLIHILATASIALFINAWVNAKNWQYVLLLVACIYTIVANIDSIIATKKNRLKLASSALSHIGFGIMILGSLTSGMNKDYLTSDPFTLKSIFNESFSEKFNKNLFLTEKRPRKMRDYIITYTGDSIIGHNRYVDIHFQKVNENNAITESFILSPHITYNKEISELKAVNPSIRRTLGYDIFTHITALPAEKQSVEAAQQEEDSLKYVFYSLGKHDTAQINNRIQIVDYRVSVLPNQNDYEQEDGDIVLAAEIDLYSNTLDTIVTANPMIAIKKGIYIYNYPAMVNDLSLKIKLDQQSVNDFLPFSEEFDAQKFNIAEGESITYNNYKIDFIGFNKNPSHPNYIRQENDIAVGAEIIISESDEVVSKVSPIYFIRDKSALVVKDYALKERLSFQFNALDPTTGKIELEIAKMPGEPDLSFEVAQGVLRNDFIVLEAIIFRGMNLFWSGSILMFLGVFLAMYKRWI